MSFYKDVQIALDTKLNTLSGSTAVAWENTEYTPVKGTEWIRPTVMWSNSVLMDIDNAQYSEGIYQVDFFYPLGNGKADILTKMDAVYDLFVGSKLTSNSVDIYIKNINRTQPIQREESWLQGILEINFKTYE